MNKIITAIVGAGLLLGTTAGSCGSPAPAEQQPVIEIEIERCEKDDHPNEPECRKAKPSVKPLPAKTPAKPDPRPVRTR
jgi:hypothetical protein